MTSNNSTRKFRWLGGAAAGALALAAVAVPLSPAQAYIGIDLGPVSIGVPGPVYYGPGPYYGPYYHHYYYGPSYYDYGW